MVDGGSNDTDALRLFEIRLSEVISPDTDSGDPFAGAAQSAVGNHQDKAFGDCRRVRAKTVRNTTSATTETTPSGSSQASGSAGRPGKPTVRLIAYPSNVLPAQPEAAKSKGWGLEHRRSISSRSSSARSRCGEGTSSGRRTSCGKGSRLLKRSQYPAGQLGRSTGSRITARPTLRTRTVPPVNRHSFGSRTAWLPPAYSR